MFAAYQTRSGDMRYAGLPSYKPIHLDGEQIGAVYDQAEVEALEAEERAQGLYLPTEGAMAMLMKYAVLLDRPQS